MINYITGKYLFFHGVYRNLIMMLLLTVSCSYDSGIIISGDGGEKKGYVRFDECYDSYAGEKDKNDVQFKTSKLAGWEDVSIKDVAGIKKGNETFVFIDKKKSRANPVTSQKFRQLLFYQEKLPSIDTVR